MEGFEAAELAVFGVEVCRIEPGFEGLLAGVPFVVEDGEPGGVAVLVFDYHVLAEDAFEGEAEAQGGAVTGLVEGVALPFVAAIAEVFKDMAGHQVHGFRGGGGALERR